MRLDFAESHLPARRARQVSVLPELETRPLGVGSELTRTIEAEVIPRLMLAHREQRMPVLAKVVAAAEVDHFANLVLHSDNDAASCYVEALRQRGIGMDRLFLDLLAPAARMLGERWVSDEATFTDVTIGLSRMQRVLTEIAGEMDEAEAPSPDQKTVLLAPARGEQHTFGLFMLSALMRRDGWAVTRAGDDPEAVVRMVRRRRFDVVGFSASCASRLEGLDAVVDRVRRASRNPDVVVLIGGPGLADDPALANGVGADGTAADAGAACAMAERLIANRRA